MYHVHTLPIQILNIVEVLVEKSNTEMPKVGVECSPTLKPTLRENQCEQTATDLKIFHHWEGDRKKKREGDRILF